MVIGKGLAKGFLTQEDTSAVVQEGLGTLAVEGKRVHPFCEWTGGDEHCRREVSSGDPAAPGRLTRIMGSPARFLPRFRPSLANQTPTVH